MYVINVNTDLLESISGDYKDMIGNICFVSEEIKAAIKLIDGVKGFNIEELTERLCHESSETEKIGERIIDLRHKTYRIIAIYRQADEKVKRNIDKLPVLIHGNISVRNSVSDVFGDSQYSAAEGPVEKSELLYGNTVMHEDWLIKLIVKNKFGG